MFLISQLWQCSFLIECLQMTFNLFITLRTGPVMADIQCQLRPKLFDMEIDFVLLRDAHLIYLRLIVNSRTVAY